MKEQGVVRLYRLSEPRRWKVGQAGDQELYFPCLVCDSREPEIAGFFAKGPAYKEILVVRRDTGNYLALICSECIKHYREVTCHELLL